MKQAIHDDANSNVLLVHTSKYKTHKVQTERYETWKIKIWIREQRRNTTIAVEHYSMLPIHTYI